MGLLFTPFLFTRIRVGRFFHTQFFFCCSFHIIVLVQTYFIEICFLLISLTLVEFRLSFEVIRMLQICMMSLSLKVFCSKKKKRISSLCFQGNMCLCTRVFTVLQSRQQVPFVNTSLVLSCGLFVCLQILSSQPRSQLLHGKGSQHLLNQTEGPHDYDSGNDTSSPPSSKTGVSQLSVTDKKRNHCKHLASPEKLKFTDRDNISDSGNSVTSYTSLCKSYREDGLSAPLFSGNGKR